MTQEEMKSLSKHNIRLNWKEACTIAMLIKLEIANIKRSKQRMTPERRFYLDTLEEVLPRIVNCEVVGVKEWLKTIESDDYSENNMFKLFAYDECSSEERERLVKYYENQNKWAKARLQRARVLKKEE